VEQVREEVSSSGVFSSQSRLDGLFSWRKTRTKETKQGTALQNPLLWVSTSVTAKPHSLKQSLCCWEQNNASYVRAMNDSWFLLFEHSIPPSLVEMVQKSSDPFW